MSIGSHGRVHGEIHIKNYNEASHTQGQIQHDESYWSLQRGTKDYQNELTKHDEDFYKAFPLSETLQHTDYNLYLEDPLGEGKLEKALDLFFVSND